MKFSHRNKGHLVGKKSAKWSTLTTLTFFTTFIAQRKGDVGGGALVRGVVLQFGFRQRRPRRRRPKKGILLNRLREFWNESKRKIWRLCDHTSRQACIVGTRGRGGASRWRAWKFWSYCRLAASHDRYFWCKILLDLSFWHTTSEASPYLSLHVFRRHCEVRVLPVRRHAPRLELGPLKAKDRLKLCFTRSLKILLKHRLICR